MIKVGQVFAGRYGVIEKVGSGGMADIYRVKDLKTQEIVAIKALKARFAKNPEYVSLFKDEAQAASEIESQYVVSVKSVGLSPDGTYFMVMEYVDGITLKEYIQRKSHLSVRETLAITAQVSMGLRAAHAHRIIHRDVKPENIILTRDGCVKLTDFGIASVTDSMEKKLSDGTLGSVHYISPEQVKGKEADERSDIYSLGICMYEMITGKLPFEKETAVAVALAHMNESMVPPSDHNPDCPIALEQIIFRCTQKSREKRYLNCTALLKDLKVAVENPDFNFERQEQEKAMRCSTQEFSKKDASRIRRENAEKEAVRSAAKKEERSVFDRVLSVVAIVLGITMLALLLYIILSFSGCIEGKHVTTPKRTESSEDIEIIVITKDPNEFNEETDTVVPDLTGMTLQQAMTALSEADLNFQLSYQQVYSEEFPVGSVIRQSYEGGTVVLKDSTIVIVLNSGKGYFEFTKNYVGKSIVDFRNDIAEYKSYITVEEKPTFSRTVPANVITSITPSSGTVNAGETITVTYSSGKPYARVPGLIGLTMEEAEEALDELLLLIGDVEEVYDDEVEKGLICYQQFREGVYLREDTRISVKISKGKESFLVPDVTRDEETGTKLTEKQAFDLLKESGFTAVKVNWYDENGEHQGEIMGQYPKAGTKCTEGSKVYVYVASESDEVVIPDVVGMKLSEVRKLLLGEPFKFILSLIQVPAESEEEDEIITKIYPEDDSVPVTRQSSVIVEYKSADFNPIAIPDVVLKSLTVARQMLMDAGWAEELIVVSNESTDDPFMDGIVFRQTPEPNVQTTTLTTVYLRVYYYEEPVTESESESESETESASETESEAPSSEQQTETATEEVSVPEESSPENSEKTEEDP